MAVAKERGTWRRMAVEGVMGSTTPHPGETPVQYRTVIVGAGSFIPARAVVNESFLDRPFFEDYGLPFAPDRIPGIVAKLKEITDISERRHASDGMVASDLALEAGRKALAAAAVDPEP